MENFFFFFFVFIKTQRMSISLLGSINVCKVNTGWADKIRSDREVLNPNNIMCPLWNGQDTYGRFVSPDSFMTKTGGCASAQDRVMVENYLRPDYMEYVALDAAGFKAPLYAGNPVQGFSEGYTQSNTRENYQSGGQRSQFARDTTCARRDALETYNISGSVGNQVANNNTLRDKGVNGVNGGGVNAGCGNWFNQCSPNLRVENYQPDMMAQANFQQRQAQAAMADYRANVNRANSGF